MTDKIQQARRAAFEEWLRGGQYAGCVSDMWLGFNAAPAASAADAGLVEALRKIMEAHRFNVSGISVTEVHAVCFEALAAHRAKGVV